MSMTHEGYRAWRLDQFDAEPRYAERLCDPHPVVDLGDVEGPWSCFTVRAAPDRYPEATVAYHGRTATWCCACRHGRAPLAGTPCAHVLAVAYWQEVGRLRHEFAQLPTWDLIELWGREVRRVRAIRCGFGPEPRNWRLRTVALFAALVGRDLARPVGEDADPVCELIEQLECVAA